MADFINTIDALGDVVVTDSIIDRTIMEFKDDQITKIGSHAFHGCTALDTIECPNVISTESYVLAGTGVTELRLGLLKTVAANAFRNCSTLAVVDLPVCTAFGGYCFAHDTGLKTLILRSETICTNPGSMFYLATTAPICSGTGYIYVPAALVDSYKAATNWSTYADQFRALEDYTVDGTTTGALDETKI